MECTGQALRCQSDDADQHHAVNDEMGAGKAAAQYNAQAFRQGNKHDRAKERAQSGLQSTDEGMGEWLDRETDAKQGLGVDEQDVLRVEGPDRFGQAAADRGRYDLRAIDVDISDGRRVGQECVSAGGSWWGTNN